MKKLIFIIIFLIFIIGCNAITKDATSLSELQIEACNAADEAGTCGTRLAEIGIVLKEDCCKALGKCC